MKEKYDNVDFVGYEFNREEHNQKNLEIGLMFLLPMAAVILFSIYKTIQITKEHKEIK